MPFALLTVFAAILGASLGSFCNVLIIRLKDGRSLLGRSACMHCQRTLSGMELVPVVSWIALRGKCRTCRTPIHLQYPLVELAGAGIGIYAVARHAMDGLLYAPGALFTATFLLFLLVVAVFDLRWQLVPTLFTALAGALLAIWAVFLGQSILATLLGALVTGGVLAALVWGSGGRWMGEGDPIVGVVIGAVLGWPLGPIALLAGFMVGGIVACILLAAGRVSRKTPIPFVPFLAFGAFLVYAWGDVALSLVAYAFGA